MNGEPERAAAVARTHEWFEHNSGWAPPDVETLAEWVADGVCRAPDDCLVTPDGWCEHGLASWKLVLDAVGLTCGAVQARQRDPFLRRTAEPSLMVPWLVELARTSPDLLRSYLPGGPIDPRTREQVILAVTEVNGCRYCAWIHGSWADYLGALDDPADVLEALLAHARASAEAGQPLDTSPLREVLPPDVVGGLRATVAQIEVANLVGNTVDGLLARATRRRPLDPPRAVAELATVALALPIAVPMLAIGGAMRALRRLAPDVPTVQTPPPGEANLLVHLLARAVPSYLANAGLRLAILRLPVPLAIGIKAGRTAATLRIGRGRIEVDNGIRPDAALVVEGDVEPLLQLATGHLVREIGSLRVKRP